VQIAKSYRKRHGVDWPCALSELAALGVRIDPARLAAWRARPVDQGLTLLVDERAPLVRIMDEAGPAPYFPRIGLCLNGRNGLVLGQSLGPASEAFGLNALKALDASITSLARRPRGIFFCNENIAAALGAWLEAVGIPGKIVPPPPNLDELWSKLG
jgi:hypothetical protein